MKAQIFAAVCIALFSGAAVAETPTPTPTPTLSPTCKAFAQMVDANLKGISFTKASSYARSAPQATQLAAELQNDIAFLKINLDLMAANKCPMPTRPVSDMMYALPASECALAQMRSDPDKDAKCDRSKWQPMGLSAP